MTKLQCLDPNLGDSLLDAARPAGSMSRDQLRHVEACASCRLSLERARRLVSTYREVTPTNAEIAAARVRHAARTARRNGHGATRRWHLLPRAITVALLLAVVASAAAQIAARRHERLREASVAEPAAKRPHRHHAHARHQLGGAPSAALPGESEADDESDVVLVADPAAEAVAPAPPVRPPAERPPAASTIVLGPPRVEPPVAVPAPPPAPARVRKTPRRAPVASEPTPGETPREELTATSWQAAAAALRVNDHARAERALDALARATDVHTRDAARLARAQLWLAQGKVDRARADLHDLAATGVTSIIRQSAREALLSVR